VGAPAGVKALAALAIALTAAGCGDVQSEDPRARLALLAAERGQGVEPPLGPAWHFRATGTVGFATDGQILEQQAELWCGGADRMRFIATSATGRNVFLVNGADGWLWTEGSDWRAYVSPELARETLLRWELLRFPWGWLAEIASAEPGATRFERTAGEMPVAVELGVNGMPMAAECQGVRAEVGDWRVVLVGARSVPHRWTWSGPSGRRTENFQEIREDVRYFDEAFRPPESGAPDRLVSGIGERFGVIRARMWRVPDAAADAPMDAPCWWDRGGVELAAVLLDFGVSPPAGATTAEEAEWWLRWSFVGTSEAAAAAGAQLTRAAKDAGLEARGEAWVRRAAADGRSHGQIALLPLAGPPR
jgi:hypothetical protein